MAFDPNQPFKVVNKGAIGFDPSQPFNVVSKGPEPVGTSFSQEVAQLGPAFMESLGRPLENMGEGFEVVGYQGVANALKGAVTEPENYVSAAERFMEPEPGESQFLGFAWQYAPRAAVEQAGQAIGSIASRAAGAAAGGVAGGAVGGPAGAAAGAATGAFVGPAIFGAAQVIGPIAKERAKNNGREVPNNQDLAAATLTAIGSGALDAIGARYLPGGEKATGKFFKRVASGFAGEAATEAPQSVIEQAGGTLGTEAGLNINAKQAIGEGLIGGTTGAGLSAVTYPFTKDPAKQTLRTPEDVKEVDIDAKSNEEAVSLMGQPGDDQNAELRTTIQEAEREIANNETLINALEPNDPERTRLELQNAEAKKIAARMRGRLEETVGLTPVESEQARLAREIAAPPAEPATTSEAAPPPLKPDAPINQRKARAKTMWDAAKPGEVYYAEGGMEGEKFRIEIKANKDGTRYAEITGENGGYVDTISLDREGSDPTKGNGLIYGADMVAAAPEAAPVEPAPAAAVVEEAAPVSETITEPAAIVEQEPAAPAPVTTPAPAEVVTPAAPAPTEYKGKVKREYDSGIKAGETAMAKPTGVSAEAVSAMELDDMRKDVRAAKDKSAGNAMVRAYRHGKTQGRVNRNAPVFAEAVDTYGITLPEGYTKQGDLYVYQPTPAEPAAEPAGIAEEPETQAKIAALKQGWTDRLAAIPEKNKRQKADAEAIIWNKQSSLDPVERQAAEEFFSERAKTEELGKLQEAMDAENNEKVDFDNARQLVESLTGEVGAAIRALVNASPKLASALENIKVQSGSPSFDGSVIRIRRTDNTPQTKAHEATHAILDKAIDEVPTFRDDIGKIIKEFFEITNWNARIFGDIPAAVRQKMEIVSKIYSQARTNYKSFGKNQDISFSKYFSDNLAFIVRSIQPSMKGYKITDQDVRFAYALTGQHEFLATIMSDQEFRDFAKQLKLYQKPKSLFERFIEAVKSLFGKKPIQGPVTQLEKVMKLVEDAINNEAYQPGPYKREYGRSFELPRKPAAEEKPTGPAPESPEGQSVPQALGNGIDIGPENNMPINRKIDSHIKNFFFLRGFFESASDRLRRNGFTRLGNAIDAYFDGARRRLGDANKIMLAPLEAYEAAPAAQKRKIEEDFQTFFAAQENKRDTDAIVKQMDPIARRIVRAWQKFGEESGNENQRVGVKVFDPKKQAWRKIGRVEKFWPRRLKPEYQRALYDPDKYAKEYNEIVEALLESGQIKDAKEAEKYLREYSPEATKNDYFSGIEKARGNPLPEKLYDYSMQVMTDYIARWAQHVSRIEQFGQKTSEQSMTLWDREMGTTRDPRTKDYIQAARDRVEGYFPNDPFLKGAAALNIWATGLHLGNPGSAMLNMVGGSTLNAMIGQPGSLGSYVQSLVELRNLGANIRDAKEKGILGRDLMNIVGDHQAILETNKVVQAGQKTADFLLKWSGFTSAEQMVRAQSLVIGKSFVRNTLNAFKNNPRGSFARRASAWMTRNNFDLDKLIVEDGTGPETDRLLRYFANISQGSYTIDQVPIFIDTPAGRFLLKYQKFSTQVMRMTWKNTFEPLFKAMTGKGETMQVPDKTRQLIYRLLQEEARSLGDNRRIDIASIPKTVSKAQGRALALIPAMMWLGAAYVGGEVLLRLRDMLFGVLMKGPEYEDILKALEDDERAAALYLSLERAWYNLIGIGALGLIGNYAQFFLDWQDRERVKNPLEPPALSVVKDFVSFVGNAIDQRTITAGDIDAYASSTLSAYRSTKRFAQSIAGFMGMEELPGVEQEMFRREVANINKYARRWAEEAGIEYRTRRPGDVPASPRSPVNRRVATYMQTGEPVAAATYAKAYIKGLEKKEQDNARQSILTGARNRQPLRLGSAPMDEAERKAFLTWLKDKVNAERFKEISELDAKYQKDYKTFLSEMKRP